MTTWLAWGSAALALALLALGVLFLALNGTATPQGALWLLGLLAFALIGGLIARHHPTNPIGWLFCAGALLSLLAGVASEYARYTLLTRPGTLPGGIWMAWLGAWIGDPGWGLLALFPFLLFPTGHLPSPRWRAVAWLASALIVEAILIHPFAPGLLDTIPPVSNPVGIPALGVIMRAERRLPYFVVLVGTFLAGLLAVVVRFRQARSEERQQLKWVAYVAAVLALLGGGDVLAFGVLGNGLVQGLADTLISLVFPVFPLVVGSAILRYRLYDIDVLINRTLVYGSLTFALGLVYVGGVVLLQPLLHQLVGQDNPLAIVTSTLTIAALFQPLRRRIQAVIDRRFYRRKYDATRTLQAFSATLRDEVDLNRLTAELLTVVEETMQPMHVSVWLRNVPATGAAGGRANSRPVPVAQPRD